MLYTAAEIRRLLFERDRSSRDGKRNSYSRILVKWLENIVSNNEWVGAEALNQLLRQAIALPEPQKSRFVVRLWDQFDRLNEMLREIKREADLSAAIWCVNQKD
ncbi:MAG: hypothetical protein NVS9B5_12550 [Terriglobales bacterium]